MQENQTTSNDNKRSTYPDGDKSRDANRLDVTFYSSPLQRFMNTGISVQLSLDPSGNVEARQDKTLLVHFKVSEILRVLQESNYLIVTTGTAKYTFGFGTEAITKASRSIPTATFNGGVWGRDMRKLDNLANNAGLLDTKEYFQHFGVIIKAKTMYSMYKLGTWLFTIGLITIIIFVIFYGVSHGGASSR